ncbi:MAG TPA: aldo/keto reductase [Jiangellaceae bacterium]|nr:aldo/keto reductase [Jiangellaceae bacterium]
MTPLPTKQLGRTGMAISRVGIGAWAFGGAGWVDTWGVQDDADSIAAIRRAVDGGVNWIDTAPIYGLGHAEEVVGRALRRIPDRDLPYVFTKAGVIWDPQRPHDKPTLVGRPTSLRSELDASLRRLGVERIDLYQMHAPPTDGTPIEEYWQTFCDLRREGKVRAIGLSNHTVAQLDAAENVGHVDTVQPRLNLIHRDAADVLTWCAAHQAGAIVYSPMASGLLSGRFTAERAAALPADDWRRGHPDFTEPALSRNLALAQALEPIARRYSVSVAAVAIAWTLASPAVSGAIVGLRRPDQANAWLIAASLRLDESDLEDIATAIERTGAGTGPRRIAQGRYVAE